MRRAQSSDQSRHGPSRQIKSVQTNSCSKTRISWVLRVQSRKGRGVEVKICLCQPVEDSRGIRSPSDGITSVISSACLRHKRFPLEQMSTYIIPRQPRSKPLCMAELMQLHSSLVTYYTSAISARDTATSNLRLAFSCSNAFGHQCFLTCRLRSKVWHPCNGCVCVSISYSWLKEFISSSRFNLRLCKAHLLRINIPRWLLGESRFPRSIRESSLAVSAPPSACLQHQRASAAPYSSHTPLTGAISPKMVSSVTLFLCALPSWSVVKILVHMPLYGRRKNNLVYVCH